MMDFVTLITQIIGGAVGGTAGGAVAKNSSMGSIGNIIAGAIGGIGGGTLLNNMMAGAPAAADAAAGGTDVMSIVKGLVGSGIGGLVVQVVVGMVMKRMRG
jgi:uncharacterized membrane protein YeaQ/YmgE (transglycosylase-associated protein family)